VYKIVKEVVEFYLYHSGFFCQVYFSAHLLISFCVMSLLYHLDLSVKSHFTVTDEIVPQTPQRSFLLVCIVLYDYSPRDK